MVFSSIVFLFVFLPIALLGYYLIGKKGKNFFLFIVSIIFYAWGGVSYSIILLLSIVFNYFIGKNIGSSKKPKLILTIGIFFNLILLFVFKYLNFVIENLNLLFETVQIKEIKQTSIVLPIGISFYTFQAISYLIDVYRNTSNIQRKFVNLGLYISLFPQLIAGPIVRYHDIDLQLSKRNHNFEKFSSGILRFCLGLAKKVIIANNLAVIADQIFDLKSSELNLYYSWIGILAYTFQIYYDFSGYSDMAIGLGKMFGFEIPENFNFPYISKNIREFWRRWHISLSSWFRDYLYIPLGGNKKSNGRTYINLLIVFVVTGFWHGASWNFLIWGLIHGFFLIIERLGFSRILNKIPKSIQLTNTFFIVIIAWVFFRSENLTYAINYIATLFKFGSADIDPLLYKKLFNNESYIIITLAILGAFNFFPSFNELMNRIIVIKSNQSKNYVVTLKTILKCAFIILVLFISTVYLVSGTYNPFIYYRF